MRRRGFTLVELLVVIGLIVLLLALFLPVLQTSRRLSKAIRCGANIRQLTLGLVAYETVHARLPFGFTEEMSGPPSGGYAGLAQYDRMAWWWFDFLGKFDQGLHRDGQVVECPSRRLDNVALQYDVLCGNYGANRSLCKGSDDALALGKEFVGRPLGLANLSSPGGTVLLLDSGYACMDHQAWALMQFLEEKSPENAARFRKHRDDCLKRIEELRAFYEALPRSPELPEPLSTR